MHAPILVGILFSLAYAGCTLCGETRLGAARSPDGKYLAQIVERNCGATTDYARHVVLQQTGLLSRHFDREAVFVIEGRSVLRMDWSKDSRDLVVSYGQGEVFRNAPQWRDVSITYRSQP